MPPKFTELAAIGLIALCDSGCSHTAPPSQLYTLPSGKQIHIVGSGPVYLQGGEKLLMMSCDTDISVDDMAELRKEVDELWEIFRKDVESAGMSRAVIRMNHNEGSGFVIHTKSYSFAFEKKADGQWHHLEGAQN